MDFVGRSPQTFDLLQHVAYPPQHRDGTVEIFQQVFKVKHDVVHRLSELVFQALLNRPTG